MYFHYTRSTTKLRSLCDEEEKNAVKFVGIMLYCVTPKNKSRSRIWKLVNMIKTANVQWKLN